MIPTEKNRPTPAEKSAAQASDPLGGTEELLSAIDW